MLRKIDWFAVSLLAGIVGLSLIIEFKTAAAPALVKGDEVAGVLDTKMQSPVIVIHHGTDAEVTLWLVFETPRREVDAGKIANGRRVKAVGRLMAGGAYRYLIVESLAEDS